MGMLERGPAGGVEVEREGQRAHEAPVGRRRRRPAAAWIRYDASSWSSRTPRRDVVLRRSAIGIDASPTLNAFDDGSGALLANFPDFVATASARRASGVAAATNAVSVVAAGAAPDADRTGGDQILELLGACARRRARRTRGRARRRSARGRGR